MKTILVVLIFISCLLIWSACVSKSKPWYCPHCNSFKNNFQVRNDSPIDICIDMHCKHCGHEVISTEKALKDFMTNKNIKM